MDTLAPQSKSKNSGPKRYVLAGILFALVVIAFGVLVSKLTFVCDDAHITFRYARNLAQGHGLRFNIGTNPPVEGFSSFLWTVTIALFEYLQWNTLLWSRIVSVACAVVLLGVLFRYLLVDLCLSHFASVAGAMFVATMPPFALWSSSGMETAPFTLALFGTCYWLVLLPARCRPWLAGLAGVAAQLLRPEGLAWPLLVLFAGMLSSFIRHDRGARRGLAIFAAIVVGVFAVFEAWRFSYFGAWLPNTAYVKVGMDWIIIERGLQYFAHGLATFTSIIVVGVGSLVLVRSPRGGPAFIAALLATSVLARCILVGGDFMAMYRFFVPAIPFLGILFALVLNKIWLRAWPAKTLAVFVALGCYVLSVLPAYDVHVVPRRIRQRFDHRWSLPRYHSEYDYYLAMRSGVLRMTKLAKVLAIVTKPGESIVNGAIGALGYYTDLIVYDMAGLTNKEVAMSAPRTRSMAGHDRVVNRLYFEKQKPDYIYAVLVPRSMARIAASIKKRNLLRKVDEAKLTRRYAPYLVDLSFSNLDGDKMLFVVKRTPLPKGRSRHDWRSLRMEITRPPT